jgi:hypothetical protein
LGQRIPQLAKVAGDWNAFNYFGYIATIVGLKAVSATRTAELGTLAARPKMTREEIEQEMVELAREYHDTYDPEIPEEIYELARRLREMDH